MVRSSHFMRKISVFTFLPIPGKFPYFCKTPYFIYEKNYSYRRRDQCSIFH